MRRVAIAAALLLAFTFPSFARTTTITLLHFSDYHSHAVPFFSEGRADQGGIARAVAYLTSEKRSRRAFVLNGGDMMNRGAPAWSDKYGCVEWSWLNGIVDAMAFGNHDSDYSADAFARCRSGLSYPILGANVVDAAGRPLFLDHGKPYTVLRRGAVKIGVIALAGSDFEGLIRKDLRPADDARFADRTETARRLVRELRESEKVDAVVLIGHAHREEDLKLAREVPGIDVIFGTHSHIRESLHRIDGTSTWFISPYQYLTYISRVELTFRGHRLASVGGGLVRIGAPMPEGRMASRVRMMEQELESDPQYAPLFVRIGTAGCELSLDDQLSRETVLGDFVTDVMRSAAGADLAFSTTSSFRQPIPPGEVRLEDLRGSLPYLNRILLYQLSGKGVRQLFERSLAKRGGDAFAQFSGLRVVAGSPPAIEARTAAGVFEPLRDDAIYRVAVTDYLALVSPVYKDLFAALTPKETGLEVRDEVRKVFARGEPVCAAEDGRLIIPRVER